MPKVIINPTSVDSQEPVENATNTDDSKKIAMRPSLTNITNSKPSISGSQAVISEGTQKGIAEIHHEPSVDGDLKKEEDHGLFGKTHALNLNLMNKGLNGTVKDFTLPKSWKKAAKPLVKNENTPKSSKEVQKFWLKTSPIYVVDAKQKPTIHRELFPKRIRGKFCYICGLCSGAELVKCSAPGCPTRFHQSCAEKSSLGGYTYSIMKRRAASSDHSGVFCPRHHCTACFADHNRSRCFYGSLVTCDQCELAWHPDCIPGGCSVDANGELTCPRHVVFPGSTNNKLSLQHCAYCQQPPQANVSLIKCVTCLRSAHFDCYSEAKIKPVVCDTDEERSNATCLWCDQFDFIRYDEYAMARFSRQWWYPCQVVKNEEFPNKKDPQLGSVGYLCVKWLPYKGKTFYNLISHNRIVAMSDHDYFFVNEAHKSEIFEEWMEAQKFMLKNFNPRNTLPKTDQVPDQLVSNGEKMIKKIQRNKYSCPELKTNRDRLDVPDFCNCPPNTQNRCGPSSACINRTLRQECPKGCDENGGCGNRRISEGQNCIQVQIKYFPAKGYGAIALEDVPTGGFVGEYVGEVISLDERKRRIERIGSLNSHEAQYYIMELDERRAIDAQYYGNDMRYVNHSCEPNCMIQQIQSDFDLHLVLIAKRNIAAGDELSFDYNFVCGEGRTVPACHCGAHNCTGILSAGKNVKQAMYDWEGKKPSGKKMLLSSGANGKVPIWHTPSNSTKKSTTKGPAGTKETQPFSSSAPVKRKPSNGLPKTPAETAKMRVKRAKTAIIVG